MAQRARVSDNIELWYESFGEAEHEAVLLHMGAGLQGTYWPVEFCERLAARDRYVIRFDTRDGGLSTHLETHLPAARGEAPYTAQDLAADVLGLLDVTGIQRAHILGASLGAVVAESIAVIAPDRVSAITMYAAMPPLERDAALAYWDALCDLPAPPEDPSGALRWGMDGARAATGPAYPFEEDRLYGLWTELIARAWYPAGIWRQAACALFTPRLGPAALAGTGVPVTIVQGTADPGYPAMRAYARAIPHARFVELEGVGHELPSGVWPALLDAATTASAVRAAQ